jgi:hypothetical protein
MEKKMTQVKRIDAKPVLPRTIDPTFKSDPPKGHALIEHKRIEWGTGVGNLIGEPWPQFALGEEIEIHDSCEWLWTATVTEIRSDRAIVVNINGKTAMPHPPAVIGQPYILPYMSGHAWSTYPEAGKVLRINGEYYKVKGKPKRNGDGDYAYSVQPVSADDYATRKGRARIKDITDPNSEAHNYYQRNVGRIIQIGDEYLHVTTVERVAYGNSEGEVFGYNTFGVGRFVSPDKAEKLKAIWDAQRNIRSLELDLRVARQDPDYGGKDAEQIAEIEQRLNAARERAKDF